ncbi:MAG: peptidoglycan DD-metalloendopeptidase family protein [Candidatus Lokiarchaeota archaeon]|nr:peptidoglycan DD-metalloendopeptidase family protein [Candidatus Lokiarchaeota archaeon]
MAKKKSLIITLCILIVGTFSALYFLRDDFDAEGRYDSSELNMLGVVYEDRSNITAFNEGYSTTDQCPWGFVHKGIDYFFANDSAVIAAAPGRINDIHINDYGDSVENRYHLAVEVQFNNSVFVNYVFEPWTQAEADINHQEALLTVTEGDWIEKSQKIATFLAIGSGAHIHFDVVENNDKPCPSRYFTSAGYTEIMEMIHGFHPTWCLCYT